MLKVVIVTAKDSLMKYQKSSKLAFGFFHVLRSGLRKIVITRASMLFSIFVIKDHAGCSTSSVTFILHLRTARIKPAKFFRRSFKMLQHKFWIVIGSLSCCFKTSKLNKKISRN